jgi:glycosyltransferase involved in cell wall biosynthesis
VRLTLCVNALEPHPGGIGRYTWELCKGLPHHPDVESVNYFGRGMRIDDPAILLEGRLPARKPKFLRALGRWNDARVLRSGLVHGPNYFLPSFAESGIITVHDLSVFRYPETHPIERVRAFEREFASSVARARHIITDTGTVRNELIQEYSIAPERVTAVHLGVDPKFVPVDEDTLTPILAPLGLEPGGYGLCVSTLEPRKKIAELIGAWRRLPRMVRDRFPLVLSGGAGWRNEMLREHVETGMAEGWVRHLGFVDEALLPSLYAGAALFVYPSIYEGFGLPPLEAMASGVPVVVSRHSCLPEVSGEAARYVEPDDSEGFTAELEAGLTDESWRGEARRLGLMRAREFTWHRCIDSTVDVYHQAD